jgi:hypothetical protein
MEAITHFGGNIGFANSNHGAMTRAPRGDVFSAPQKFLTSGVDALKATGAALLGKNNQGSMVTLAIGQANIITHIGNGSITNIGINIEFSNR